MRIRALITYFLLVILLSLLGTEFYLRWTVNRSIKNKSGEAGMLYATQVFNKRIWNVFLSEKPVEYRWLNTPNSYANSESITSDNLKKIAKENSLPPLQSRNLLNFLRAEKDWQKFTFKVSTDERGARFCKEVRKKGKREVWLFGSYQAFGHGVNDCDTYSSVIEKGWNQNNPHDQIIIRNFGLQSVVSVTGLALLEKQMAESSKPAAIIFDFGLVDLLMDPQNIIFEPQALFFKKESLAFKHLEKISHFFLRNIAHKSYLYNLILNRILEKNMQLNIESWRRVNTAVLAIAQKHRIPILFLDQFHPAKIADSEYQALISNYPRGKFYSVNKLLRSLEPLDQKNSDLSWLDEFGEEFSAYYRALRPEAVYNADLIQINKIAHKRIANNLFPLLMEMLKNESTNSTH